ncbi:hypothetical protein HPB50_010102 [Hyalomma asiaticum]|uniref:Uncharacterized protein n=1 Tax=Hyalomma asiaticum TaxID=266040 RepID=A0ACB7RQ81_HYAAI|nr:hypothetical protein HPB50_010102 [Hyalomma asiaticum]
MCRRRRPLAAVHFSPAPDESRHAAGSVLLADVARPLCPRNVAAATKAAGRRAEEQLGGYATSRPLAAAANPAAPALPATAAAAARAAALRRR